MVCKLAHFPSNVRVHVSECVSPFLLQNLVVNASTTIARMILILLELTTF